MVDLTFFFFFAMLGQSLGAQPLAESLHRVQPPFTKRILITTEANEVLIES